DLALGLAAGSHHRSVAAEPQGRSPSGRDGGDVTPGGEIGLPVAVPSCGDDRAVGAQTDGVRAPGVTGRMDVAGCNGGDPRPPAHVTLASPAVAPGDDRAVLAEHDGMSATCRQRCHVVCSDHHPRARRTAVSVVSGESLKQSRTPGRRAITMLTTRSKI